MSLYKLQTMIPFTNTFVDKRLRRAVVPGMLTALYAVEWWVWAKSVDWVVVSLCNVQWLQTTRPSVLRFLTCQTLTVMMSTWTMKSRPLQDLRVVHEPSQKRLNVTHLELCWWVEDWSDRVTHHRLALLTPWVAVSPISSFCVQYFLEQLKLSKKYIWILDRFTSYVQTAGRHLKCTCWDVCKTRQ